MDFQTLRAKAILRYGNLIPEDRFKLFMMDVAPAIFGDFLDPDAAAQDEPDTVLMGSGFDPSTLIADLEAGRF
jgi:hypothetical protein